MENKPDVILNRVQAAAQVYTPSAPFRQVLKRQPVFKQIDAMTGKSMDPVKVEKGRLRMLSWANKQETHQLVKDDGARGGSMYVRSGCKAA